MKTIGILFLFTINIFVNAQNIKYGIKNYLWEEVHNGYDIKQMDDGNYIMHAQCLDYSTVKWASYFAIIDASLNIVDIKSNASITHDTGCFYMFETNNGFLACGFTQENPFVSNYSCIFNYNVFSDNIEYKTVGAENYSNFTNSGLQMDNENILLVGGIRPLDTIPNYTRFYLITLDENLNELSDTVYINPPYDDLRCYINKIIATPDGNYMLFATINDLYGQPPGDIMLLKINELGDILWQKVYDFGDDEEPYDIINTLDGGFLFSLVENLNDYDIAVGHLVKIAENGVIEWHLEQMTFVDNDYYFGYPHKVVQLADSSYLIAGHDYPPDIPQYHDADGLVRIDATLVKLNAQGELLWQRIYHSEANDYIYDMIVEQNDSTGKSGFVMCGRNDSLNYAYALLIKTNCMGLLSEPKASFQYEITENNIVQFLNESQYVYPDSIDGGHFVWDFGDGNTSTDFSPANEYSSDGFYETSLTAVVCNDTNIYKQMVCINNSFHQFPEFSYQNTDSMFLFFENQSTFEPAISATTANYIWNFGDGNSSTAFSPTHQYAENGVYEVSLQSIVCHDTLMFRQEVCVGLPSASFSYEHDTANWANISFSNETTWLLPAEVSYFWNFGDNTTDTQVNPTHEYLANGSYEVKLNAIFCGDTVVFSRNIDIFGVGITENDYLNNSFQIFPNPTQHTISIITNEMPKKYNIKIYNHFGQIVHESQNYETNSPINIGHFPEGSYFLQVQNDMQSIVKPFIVSK